MNTETREKRIEMRVAESEREMIDEKAASIYMSRTEFIVRACRMVNECDVQSVREAERAAK